MAPSPTTTWSATVTGGGLVAIVVVPLLRTAAKTWTVQLTRLAVIPTHTAGRGGGTGTGIQELLLSLPTHRTDATILGMLPLMIPATTLVTTLAMALATTLATALATTPVTTSSLLHGLGQRLGGFIRRGLEATPPSHLLH
jgi:hypothetical protein